MMSSSRAGESSQQKAERMADLIASVTRDKSVCDHSDLLRGGFTPDEIERHGAMAYALAAVQMMNDQPGGTA
ncbi:MAG: hypothetical protein KGI37_07600 [Alphaproteobacteria bacterium]|nr:hypothetical protein [Alphaproteobacteria bacterium]